MNYSPEISAKAQRIIDERRTKASLQLEERRKEIEKNAPEVLEIQRQAALAASELSKLIINHKNSFSESFSRIKKNNLDAQNYIREILSSKGYPEDYLDIKYHCSNCRDTGFDDNGTRCICFKELASSLSIEELNRSANMPECDFEHFKLSYYSEKPDPNGVRPYENMREVFRFCKRYAEGFSLKSGSLLMIGNPGLGKTHMSVSIAKEVLKKGYTCAYGSVQNYLIDIERERFGRGVPGKDTLSLLLSADLLVLDDLGSENCTQFTESVLYNIINTRINTSVPTIVNTNYSAAELRSKYNPRIISRLFGEYSKVNFYGQDIRFIK